MKVYFSMIYYPKENELGFVKIQQYFSKFAYPTYEEADRNVPYHAERCGIKTDPDELDYKIMEIELV